MPELGRFARALRARLWKPSVDEEVSSEIAHHVDMLERDLVAQGVDPTTARSEAQAKFGDVGRIGAECRDLGQRRDEERRRSEGFAELKQDVRFAVRQLRRAPGFTLIAALTLAAGIGATTAIFSIVHAVVLRPLPFHEPERLLRVYATSPATTQSDEVSPRTFAVWRRENRSFERIAPIETRSFTFAEGTQLAEQVTGVRTTADYFPMLGVAPIAGRVFLPEEDERGRDRVAVLSHQFWENRFAGDRSVIGRTVRINALPYVVIGVMPATFDLSAGQVDLWMPIAFTAEDEVVETAYLDVVGRLRRDATPERAQAELTELTQRIDVGQSTRVRGARVLGYAADVVGAYRTRLLILLGAVGLVLLIACVNVANLLMARGAGRAKEIAIRAALGAGRGRIVRQMLAEGLVLAFLGGGAGLALAFWGIRILEAASPEGVPRLEQASIDGVALAFTLAVSLVSSVVFGIVPALRSSAADPQRALKEGGRSSGAVASDGVRQTLVVLEVALSLVLLVGSGLLIRSAILLQRVDPGLDAQRLWSGAVTLPPADYAHPERLTRTFERIVESVREVPGVTGAAVVSVAPFTGLRALGLFVPEGRPIDDRNTLLANFRLVSPGLFQTLGVAVREGRDFSERDEGDAPAVVIVNEAFAQLAWPGEEALGRRLLGPGGTGSSGPAPREVVGIVANMREDGLREESRPAVYYPIRQLPAPLWQAVQNSLFLVARTRVEPLTVTNRVQDAVSAIDRGVPVFEVRSMEQRMARMLATARFNTRLLTTLGAVGLLLAAVGSYGVIAFFVGQRTREIGVRLALGATPGQVLSLVVRQGMRPVIIGVALGGVAALGATRVLGSQLYGVAPTDPITFGGVALGVVLAAVLAAVVPARRAARVDPKRALVE